MIVYGAWQVGGGETVEEEGAPEVYVATLRAARALAREWLAAEVENAPGEDPEEQKATALGAEVRIKRYRVTPRARGRSLVLALLNHRRWVAESEEIEWWSMSRGRAVRKRGSAPR